MSDQPKPENDSAMISELLADARQKLVDIGGRNRLINTVRDKSLSRAINVVQRAINRHFRNFVSLSKDDEL
ncbi:hypothetical protein N9L06_04950 [Mariniblastus sp.]|nr:hypothetical protein [Mariniblastus sp.]